jgi:hypothetical protein
MALLHKLCHTLGGSFDTPRVETHAIRLPHMVGFNAAAVYDRLEPISAALGGVTPGKALHRFASGLGAPTGRKDLGLTETDPDRAATTAEKNPYFNPRPFGQAEIRALLQTRGPGADHRCENGRRRGSACCADVGIGQLWPGLASLGNSGSVAQEREILLVLDHILKFMTLGTVIVGRFAIYTAPLAAISFS